VSDRTPLLARRGLESHTWHLDGLTSGARVRDDARHDVPARKAAELQQVDARLGEVERLPR
jgi:hypothetical protein